MSNDFEIRNPILPGFHPDPSICRRGEDYFLITSTFEFFPGIPIYRSKDLVSWELIGQVVTRRHQFEYSLMEASRGLFAPTIRYHDSRFYVTVTDVTQKGNCLLSAEDPRGPWSDPVCLDQEGIDPSLFFDEDGRAYLATNASVQGILGIALSEIEISTGKRLSPVRHICPGSGGRFPEAPRIFHIHGIYYLLLSEGGTEYGHMVTLFRSNAVWGPYEGCPSNPILSSRDDSSRILQCTGHADIVSDAQDNWWAVFLATRSLPGVLLHNLGRETCLSPVVWDKGWFYIKKPELGNPGRQWKMEKLLLPQKSGSPFVDQWLHIRIPEETAIQNDPQGRWLQLTGKGVGLSDALGAPAFCGWRQSEHRCRFFARVDKFEVPSCFGLSAYYNNQYHYSICVTASGQGMKISLVHVLHGITYLVSVKEVPCIAKGLALKIEADDAWYRFLYCLEGKGWEEIGRGRVAGLCSEGTLSMTFTGTLLGVYSERGVVRFSTLLYASFA